MDPFLGVYEQNALTDFQILVKMNQSTKLLAVVFQCHEELLDSFHLYFLLLQQDPDRLLHKLLSDLQDLPWHGSRNQANLSVD